MRRQAQAEVRWLRQEAPAGLRMLASIPPYHGDPAKIGKEIVEHDKGHRSA